MKFLSIVTIGFMIVSCNSKPVIPATATLWQPGVVSSQAPEFSITFNSTMTEVYFNRTTPDRSSMQIMTSRLDGGKWSEPTALPFSTGEYKDVDPFLLSNGSRLIFSSDRPKTPGDQSGNWDTWFLDKTNAGWSNPINAGAPLNSDSAEIYISIAESGNAYFVSERDGIRGVKISRFENGAWQETESIILKLRGEPIYAGNPCISADETFLITAVRDPEGNQTPDLFISRNENGQWSELENLGPKVNHPNYADFAPALSKDNEILFFTSERPGVLPEQAEGVRPPGDIYWVSLASVFDM
ncbi:MAG: hypothetical protein RIM99_13000 [Cyclobacteriaceae bacterium]